MAAVVPHECPYCGHDNGVFTVVSEYLHPASIGSAPDAIFVTLASCGTCHRGVTITFESPDRHTPMNHAGHYDGRYGEHPLNMIDFQPKPADKEPPKHLPSDVDKALRQAYRAKKVGDWEPAVIMARKAIELAIKKIAPDTTGMLGNRINQLGKKSLLPQAMLDWAVEAKNIGNDGVHDADLGNDAEAIARNAIAFTDMFLTYTITMPETVRILRDEG